MGHHSEHHKSRALDVGGQALIEGVMMKKGLNLSMAVRLENGDIKVKKQKLKSLHWLLKLPLVRGTVMLFYILIIGIKALMWSANQQLDDEEELSTLELFGTLAVSALFGLAFFVGVPFGLTWLTGFEGVRFNILEGFVRLGIFLLYIYAISFMKDIHRMFQYDGAEHMAANCYEFGEELTVKNVRKYSTVHPRCGTSFIMLVLVVSIIMFTFIDTGSHLWNFLLRFPLLPVIAGIGYELLRVGGKFRDSIITNVMITPGKWVQRITTQKPDDKMIEVAIVALKHVLD
jgi:uncharacterized protein YqhQ